MKIVCISDTHNCNGQIAIPDGDLLIHAGDATINGTVAEIMAFNKWFAGQPHEYKIFVAGNHDWLFERQNIKTRGLLDVNIIYMQDSFVEIEGRKIYGAPWQPRFYDWAFNVMRGAEIAAKWQLIPEDIDILITHGPPHKILDEVKTRFGIENGGCEDLRRRVQEIAKLGRLKLHVFGHFHYSYGVAEDFGVRFVNASSCDEEYAPVQMPVIVEVNQRVKNYRTTKLEKNKNRKKEKAVRKLIPDSLLIQKS